MAHVLRVILLILAASVMADPLAAQDSRQPAKVPPEQGREANQLLAQYRAAAGDLQKKLEIAQKLHELGPAAQTALAAAIQRDLHVYLRRYSSRFQTQAAALAKKQIKKTDLKQIKTLRQTVLDLQKKGEGLTHEILQQVGEPVLRELEKAIIIDRAEVLEQSPELQAERKRIEPLGQLWELGAASAAGADGAKDKSVPGTPNFDEYLQGEERLAAALAVPMDPSTRAVLAYNVRMAERIDPEEARAILALNLTRNLLGLSALAIDLKLCEAARGHSGDMVKLNFFAHESPVSGKKTPWDRAKLAGTSASAENIFRGPADGKAANRAWFLSPGHHRNMLGNHSRVGIGRNGGYFTEMFGK